MPHAPRVVAATLAALALALAVAPPAAAQAGAASPAYKTPPAEMLRIVDAPPPPFVSVSPAGTSLLLVQGIAMPSIEDLAAPRLALAGSRIDPGNDGPHNPSRYVSLTVKDIASGAERPISLPDAGRVGFPSWSPDGSLVAFAVTHDDTIELWVAETTTGRSRKLADELNATRGGAFRWMPDGRTLLCRFVPRARGEAPQPPRAPKGPVIQETAAGSKSQVRTYQDLLAGPHDEALFDHHMTAQAALVAADGSGRTDIGAPAVFTGLSPSPSGEYLLVQRLVRPYSYQVPASRFPRVIEVWNTSGQVVKTLATKPLADEIPIGGVETGMRGVGWMPTRGDTLQWLQALDGGDPKADVSQRDRLLVQAAPFDGRPVEWMRTEHRAWSLDWVDDSAYGVVREYDRDRRWVRAWVVNPDIDAGLRGRLEGAVDARARLLYDRSVNDRYGDIGSPVTTTTESGHRVILTEGGAVYLSGSGATPEGDRPFLARLDIVSLEREELWRCAGDNYETVVDLLPSDGLGAPPRLLTRREDKTTPPNYFVQTLGGGDRRALTAFEDPAPEMQGLSKELVTYTRDDGVTLTATLYLPPGHVAGQKHPLLVWAYPREYTDSSTAGQVRGSPHRYTRLRGYSHLFMLTQGWAIMDGAAMPVVGDPETVNETFVEQIVASAKAAIDEAVRRGVADRERTAVGGHSYGAFMTANLLAHSDLFKAGIARSGAYNRTLTPFGFQSERRTLWEATDTYVRVSPFMHAHKIDEPILLTHGEQDSNSGTYPIQSERLFHALRGHGATARLVMLPHESHGYRARESVLHVLAEQAEWLAKHVGPVEPTP